MSPAGEAIPVDVVLVGVDKDPHIELIADELTRLGGRAATLCLDDVCSSALSWEPGGILEMADPRGTRFLVGHETTVWWRRPGSASAPTLDPIEQLLVADEVAAILPGALEAVGVVWVDPPWVLLRARWKLLQLTEARRLGIKHPATLVTGDVKRARRFADSHGEVIAKATSSGEGIAPFTGIVVGDELGAVVECPTTLQEYVQAEADLRIVTVGETSFVWKRPRGEEVDWRQIDPDGAAFAPVAGDPTHGGATRLAAQLGLSFSVQDWLASSGGPVFLEVNAQGQWVFLEGANRLVVAALAHHLLGPR